MKVTAVTIHRVDLPLQIPLEHASASTPVLEEVVLALSTSSGYVGLSEVRGNGLYATGADTDAIVRALVQDVAPTLVGGELASASDRAIEVCDLPLVWAAVDIASYDAQARWLGVPLWQMLGQHGVQGGKVSPLSPFPTHYQIGFCEVDDAVNRARDARKSGFKRVKLRVGRSEPDDDVRIIREVWQALDDEVALAVDANGAWSADEAIQVLSQVEVQLSWVEQPTSPGDLDAMRRVRDAVKAPVVADESVAAAEDVVRIAEAGAADGVHLKLEKAGTVDRIHQAVATAGENGLAVYMGQMDQGRLGSAATAHIAATVPAEAYELWGFQHVVDDFTEGLDAVRGTIAVPAGSGTGVDIDRARLRCVGDVR